jgi:hypothetical protein
MSQLYGIKPGARMDETFQVTNGSYSSFNVFDINFLNLPVYRAETKEEFLFDLASFTGSLLIGGWQAGLKFVSSRLETED